MEVRKVYINKEGKKRFDRGTEDARNMERKKEEE